MSDKRTAIRTEQEMMELIIHTAKEEPRIRAAVLSGSRANPNAPKDRFCDYDICYIVTETRFFRENRAWINRFGDRLYMQYPEESPYFPSDHSKCYGWLIQFADGNRLDLHVCTLDSDWQEFTGRQMYRILLDKDCCIPDPGAPTDREFWVKRPTQEEYLCTCNEFWWCLNNIAKGLWRGEVLYVMDMLNDAVRPMLLRMLSWKAGIDNRFQISVGKSCKYLNRWIPEDQWNILLKTYPRADTEEIWNAVFIMCDLFEESAAEVAQGLSLRQNCIEAENSRKYLEDVHAL